MYSRGLDLNPFPESGGRSGHDDEHTARGFLVALNDLPDGTDRLYDHGACSIRDEARQRFERATPLGIAREGENVRVPRLQSGHRRLQNLEYTLIEQGDFRRWSMVERVQGEAHLARGQPKRLEIARPIALQHCIRQIRDTLRALAHRNCGNHRIGQRIYGYCGVPVF